MNNHSPFCGGSDWTCVCSIQSKKEQMANQAYPVDPMAAFYAAVTAVENGSVGEVELEFRTDTEDVEMIVTMAIRKEARPTVMFNPYSNQKEE